MDYNKYVSEKSDKEIKVMEVFHFTKDEMHVDYFTTTQFILSMLLVPIIMTLTEAYSPHTWDTPFLMFTGYVSLMLIMQF